MKQTRRFGFEVLESRQLLSVSPATGPVISEIMADNESIVFDGTGTASDWIELYNPTDAEIDLSGWYLSDKYTQNDDGTVAFTPKKTSWTFPDETKLGAGEYLLVFTGNDLVTADGSKFDSAGNLHANFGLSKSGDAVILAKPETAEDGSVTGYTVVDSIIFGSQMENYSYGLRQDAFELFGANNAAQILVPTANNYPSDWMSPEYTPGSSWTTGTADVGFDTVESFFNVTFYQSSATSSTSGLDVAKSRINAANAVGWDTPSVIDYKDGDAAGNFSVNTSLPMGNVDYYTTVAKADFVY